MRSLRLKVALFILVLGMPFFTKGQTQQLKFKHLSFREGLAQSPISTIIKDSKGFVWLGNWKGLTRYDGYAFRTFQHNPSNPISISNNRVNSIIEDRNKQLWIGTSNGLNRYNPATEVFKRIDIKDVKGGRNYIASVLADRSGQIWTATFAGVKLVDTTKWVLKELPNLNDKTTNSITSAVIFTLFQDRSQRVWVGTKSGVKCFDPATKKLVPVPEVVRNSAKLMGTKIIVIRQDKSGDIWFGSETAGLFRYEVKANKLSVFNHEQGNPKSILSDWMRDIYVYDDHNIWIGTRNGLSIYNTLTNQFTNYSHNALDPDGLNDSTIWSFMQDEAAGIWIGTFAGGLNVYYPANANFTNIGESLGQRLGLSHPVVNALTDADDGGLWIGTYGGGINYLNRKTKENRYFEIRNDQKQTRNGVKSLAKDANGNLWVGTLDGLCSFDTKTKKIKFFKFDITQGKLSENLINAIATDQGTVWAGTNGGGLRHLQPDGSYVTYTNQANDRSSISDNFVTALLRDNEKALWVGTQNGLNYYDKETKKFQRFTKTSKANTLSNNSVTTLLKDSKNRLWIGTEAGLNYYHAASQKFYALNEKAKLTDDIIRSIIEDNQQNIWLSTDNGLYKLQFKQFKLPFNEEDIIVTHYNAKDGLASNQFSTNASLKLPNGELLFGGINGLSSFFPDRISINKLKPKVAFTDFLVRNREVPIDSSDSPLKQSITFTKSVQLNHDEGYLTIKFAALNFVNPEKNQYAYKMDGVAGDDWHYSGTQREANYTNLLPGKYTFMVKAANNDGVWNEEPLQLKIVVSPPWWQTWWAYMLYAVIFYFIAKTIYDFLKNRARLKRDLYLEHIQNERQQELYQMKLNFFTNISHEIRTPLTLILGPLEKLMSNANSKPLQTIKSNADRLMKLVTELLDFRKVEEGHMKFYFGYQDIVPFCNEMFESFQGLAQDGNIKYQFIAPDEPVFVLFDRNQLEKAIFNVLSNAFKFTPVNGEIVFSVSQRKDKPNWVDIDISDNGKGIPADMQAQLFESFFQVDDRGRQNIGSGIGLALAKSIVEQHKGEIKVSSSDLTIFTISLQTGTNHLTETTSLPEEQERTAIAYEKAGSDILPCEPQDPIPSFDKKKYSLFVVEDNVEVRTLIVDALDEDYQVLVFDNGLTALEHMKSEIPDLIVSDIMMPGMDGLTLCERVKTSEETNHIPVVLLTARASVSNQVDGLSIGADAYISKPFSLQVLTLNIKNLLRTQEILKGKYSAQFLKPTDLKVSSPEEKFLLKLRSIIVEKMGDSNFDVNTLTDEIGMSRTVLYKKVQTLTNYSVADLIKQMRLNKAAELLKTTSFPIAEIAYMVGFNDRKYFSKEFKKEYQVSPSEYVRRG
ncbi:MAG: hybrid sensor histidine kinase/response regulator [Pedobacter sp.]|nr:MAG: hybrid sensor histidine kinase/response regulator [Pedobacter sp.]